MSKKIFGLINYPLTYIIYFIALIKNNRDERLLWFNGFDYAYTDRGNIDAITESGETTRDRAYSYDELERLTEVSVPTSSTQAETYELDPEGNRLSSHLSGLHQTDEANRLTSDDSYTYVYDLSRKLAH